MYFESKITRWALGLLVLAALLISGCGDQDDAVIGDGATSTASQSLIGDYSNDYDYLNDYKRASHGDVTVDVRMRLLSDFGPNGIVWSLVGNSNQPLTAVHVYQPKSGDTDTITVDGGRFEILLGDEDARAALGGEPVLISLTREGASAPTHAMRLTLQALWADYEGDNDIWVVEEMWTYEYNGRTYVRSAAYVDAPFTELDVYNDADTDPVTTHDYGQRWLVTFDWHRFTFASVNPLFFSARTADGFSGPRASKTATMAVVVDHFNLESANYLGLWSN